MRARSSSVVSVFGGFSACRACRSSSRHGARNDQRLDAAVQLRREDVVALGDVLKRDAVRDDVARLQVAVANVLEQARPLPLHRALVHPQRQPLVHGVAELHRAEHRPVGPITETVPPLRTESIAQFSATGEPPCSFSFAAVTCCMKLPSASAPTASMATSTPDGR